MRFNVSLSLHERVQTTVDFSGCKDLSVDELGKRSGQHKTLRLEVDFESRRYSCARTAVAPASKPLEHISRNVSHPSPTQALGRGEGEERKGMTRTPRARGAAEKTKSETKKPDRRKAVKSPKNAPLDAQGPSRSSEKAHRDQNVEKERLFGDN